MATSAGILKRLTLGMSGQAFSRAIYALNAIALVPILVKAWGLEGYGQWIAVTALASYMSYSNFGLVTTSANEIVMSAGRRDFDHARHTFQMAINLALYVVLPLVLLIVACAWLAPISRLLKLTSIGQFSAALIISLAALQLWLLTVRGILVATLYATGSYGGAYYLSGFAKLIELGAIGLAVAGFGAPPVFAAAIMTTLAGLDLLVVSIWARRVAPWARLNLRVFDRDWIAEQARPAVGFLVSSLATQGLLVQGPRVVLGILLGGTAVAVYSIYTTAMRLVDQLVLMVVMPLEVEIAHSVGANDPSRTHRLIVIGTQLSFGLFLAASAGLLIFGPVIFHTWTAGRVGFSYITMIAYLALSASNILGRVSAHALISTNRLFGPSFIMLLCSAAGLSLGALASTALGVMGMVLGCIIGEILNSLTVLHTVSKWQDRPLHATLISVMDIRRSFSEVADRLKSSLSSMAAR